MNFNPHITQSVITGIALLSALLIVLIVWRAQWMSKTKRSLIILLRLFIVGILVIIMLNPVRELDTKHKAPPKKNLVLLDHSTSMNIGNNATRWEQMMNDVLPLMDEEFENPVEWLLFDSLCLSLDSLETWNKKQASGTSTHLMRSIEDLLQQANNQQVSNLIICSDGQTQDKNRLGAAIAAARSHGTAISVMGYGKKTALRNASIDNVDVAVNASPNEKLNVNAVLNFNGVQGEAFSVQLWQNKKLIDETKSVACDGNKHVALHLKTGVKSANYELRLKPFKDEISVIDNQCSFHVNVSDPRIRVLYMEGTNANYQKTGGGYWPAYRYIEQACNETGKIDVDPYVVDRQSAVGGEIYHVKSHKKGYPKTREELFTYDVVICSDINRTIFSDAQLKWTRELIEKNGGGFCMIGGNTSFGSGGWDKTVLEKMIPVDMSGYQRGYTSRTIYPTIPTENLKHPIWQLSDQAEQNNKIIKNHPPFHGTNYVQRAKPGASILAYWKNNKNMPLICIQSYGKGRSMAFTSDAAGGWGEGYQDKWGPNRRGNKYYRKFWANTVLWLAENSLRNKSKDLLVSTNRISYFSNTPIEIRAHLHDKESIYQVQAQLLEEKWGSIQLHSIGNGVYKGYWQIPQNYAFNKASFMVKAIHPETKKELSHSVQVNIIPANNEFAQPNPDFKVLKKLMAMTGGKNIKTADELEVLLNDSVLKASEKSRKATLPLWNNWYLFALMIFLWTSEWSIRKWG